MMYPGYGGQPYYFGLNSLQPQPQAPPLLYPHATQFIPHQLPFPRPRPQHHHSQQKPYGRFVPTPRNPNTDYGYHEQDRRNMPRVSPNNKRYREWEDEGPSSYNSHDRPSSSSHHHKKVRRDRLERPPGPADQDTQITEGIWRYFVNNRQTEDMYLRKVELRDALYEIFKGIFPYCGLYMVGSSMSGFATKSSDLDLCLMVSFSEVEGKKEAVEILIAIQRAMRCCTFHRKSQVIRARVPILKFEDKLSGVECDLNINNSVGIRNTHLLRCYAAMDWRVRPLMLITKRWARFHDINDASKKTISSYSLCLMMIHYLQCGTSPKVLDSVQQLYPNDFKYEQDIRNLKMHIKHDFKSKNSQSLGALFLGFLEYYAVHFNFTYDVISVRQGQRLPFHMVRMYQNDLKQWGPLKIEEPFNLMNTARSVYDTAVFIRVQRVIRKSYNMLASTRDLGSILSTPF